LYLFESNSPGMEEDTQKKLKMEVSDLLAGEVDRGV
jgi:hypothetical protein